MKLHVYHIQFEKIMLKKAEFLAAALLLAVVAVSVAAEVRLFDFWDEALPLFSTSGQIQTPPSGQDKPFRVDCADHVMGDSSIFYTPGATGFPPRFGFCAGRYNEDTWHLDWDYSFRMALKADGEHSPAEWMIVLTDCRTGSPQTTARRQRCRTMAWDDLCAVSGIPYRSHRPAGGR
jgi:hypothetical protein